MSMTPAESGLSPILPKIHDIIRRGLALERMEHRGAESADNKTGDGGF